jgi:GNAT superfamily N-acetyltransferase
VSVEAEEGRFEATSPSGSSLLVRPAPGGWMVEVREGLTVSAFVLLPEAELRGLAAWIMATLIGWGKKPGRGAYVGAWGVVRRYLGLAVEPEEKT